MFMCFKTLKRSAPTYNISYTAMLTDNAAHINTAGWTYAINSLTPEQASVIATFPTELNIPASTARAIVISYTADARL